MRVQVEEVLRKVWTDSVLCFVPGEADPERGFMARLMALCSLPRTNPGNRLSVQARQRPL